MNSPHVAKLASGDSFSRPALHFGSAREAFRAFLQAAFGESDGVVLLPAYIGWSAREGSGVFDPVRELGLPFDFYRVDRHLRVDLQDLRRRLERRPVAVLVLIHYFGTPDPGYADAVALGREFGTLVVEDEAHALLTDVVAGACGRLGDACILSLHKLLPVAAGGMLVFNSRSLADRMSPAIGDDGRAGPALHDFDLFRIARVRRRNAALLESLLAPLGPAVRPLWALDPVSVPQTYPVVLDDAPRDVLYDRLNDAGFGVVSLYHTLIDPVDAAEHPEAHWLSRRILNLPVHQDAAAPELMALVACLHQELRARHPAP